MLIIGAVVTVGKGTVRKFSVALSTKELPLLQCASGDATIL